MSCIIRLNGGLGNQLFQYAVGRAIAHRYDCELLLDSTQLAVRNAAITPRSYELTPFNIAAVVMSVQDSHKAGLPPTRSDRWLARLGKRLHGRKYVREQAFVYDPTVLQHGGAVVLDGFWQTEKYFAHIRPQLLHEISTSESPELLRASAELQSQDSVSLHVRRGDYVTNAAASAFHGVCSPSYYQAAIALLERRVANPKYFVFTDDPEWVASNRGLFGRDLTIVAHEMTLRPHEEMLLMSRCKHNIIANSSFSWWGAWLNRNESACVIAPATWFRQLSDAPDVIPERWEKVA